MFLTSVNGIKKGIVDYRNRKLKVGDYVYLSYRTGGLGKITKQGIMMYSSTADDFTDPKVPCYTFKRTAKVCGRFPLQCERIEITDEEARKWCGTQIPKLGDLVKVYFSKTICGESKKASRYGVLLAENRVFYGGKIHKHNPNTMISIVSIMDDKEKRIKNELTVAYKKMIIKSFNSKGKESDMAKKSLKRVKTMVNQTYFDEVIQGKTLRAMIFEHYYNLENKLFGIRFPNLLDVQYMNRMQVIREDRYLLYKQLVKKVGKTIEAQRAFKKKHSRGINFYLKREWDYLSRYPRARVPFEAGGFDELLAKCRTWEETYMEMKAHIDMYEERAASQGI